MARNPNPSSKGKWLAPDRKEYPIEDLPWGASIFVPPPNAADIACATRGEPTECALAQVWKRMANVPVAQIGSHKCYLPIRRDGEIVVLRCKTSAETRRVLDDFDRTGVFPEQGFFLHGIPPSEEMESKRAQQKRHRARWGSSKNPLAVPRKERHIRSASRARVVPKP